MKLDHFAYFLAIVEEGSISHASEKLFMSHQKLSAIVKRMEEEAGCQLFVRRHAGVELTPYGEAFVRAARTALGAYERFKRDVRAIRAKEQQKVVIFAAPMAVHRLEACFRELAQQMGKVVPKIIELNSEDILARLAEPLEGVEDRLGVIAVPYDELTTARVRYRQLSFYPMRMDEFVVCAGQGTAWAQRETISLQEFVNGPVVDLESATASPAVDKVIRTYGDPELGFASSNLISCLEATRDGCGLMLLPTAVWDNPSYAGITAHLRCLAIEEGLTVAVCAVAPQGLERNPLASSFLSALRQGYAREQTPGR